VAAVRANISRYRISAGYRYRVRITNRRLLKTAGKFNRAGFTTRRDAEAYARRIQPVLAQLEAGDVELGHTFGELIEEYEADALPRLNAKDRVARRRQLEWWRDQLGSDTPIATVTPPRISRALAALAKQPPLSAPRGKLQPRKADGRTLSASTVNRYRAGLSAVFTFAVKDLYWIDQNPVHRTRLLREPDGRVRYLEPEEIRRLGECIDRRSGHLQLLFWLAICTGARVNELLTATWRNLTFAADGSAMLRIPTSKNGEPRCLPVTLAKAVTLLKVQRIRFKKTGDLIFPPERRGKKHAAWSTRWREALLEAGIDDFRFHDLRHCFASYCAMDGLDGLQIADLTGHKTLAMVRRYSHLNPRSRLKNAARAVGAMGLALSEVTECDSQK
jgi:integrase